MQLIWSARRTETKIADHCVFWLQDSLFVDDDQNDSGSDDKEQNSNASPHVHELS